jgi:hypothetical protein
MGRWEGESERPVANEALVVNEAYVPSKALGGTWKRQGREEREREPGLVGEINE